MQSCYHDGMIARDQGRVVTTLRLPQAKHKRLRLEVIRRGTSLQKALEQAIDVWLSGTPQPRARRLPGLRLRGILRDSRLMEIREEERRQELARDRGRQ